MLPPLLLLTDPRFSPQVLPALHPPVVDPRSSPQVRLHKLPLIPGNALSPSPVLVTQLMSHLQILSSLVTTLLQVLLIRKAVNSCVVNHALSATGLPQKKGVIPYYCYLCPEIQHIKDVSCVDQSSFVKNVINVPTAVPYVPVGEMGSPRHQPRSVNSPQRRLNPPLPVLAKLDQVTHNNKLLCKSPQELLPVGGMASAVRQKCSRIGQKLTIPGLLQPVIFGPQPNNRWRPILDLSALNRFLKTEYFKMETPETIRTSLQAGEWVTSIDFKDAYFHIPIYSQSRKYMRFHIQDKTY